MIRASHIVQLLTYAACELEIMAETGDHDAVEEVAPVIRELAGRVVKATERTSSVRWTPVVDMVIRQACELWQIRASDMSGQRLREKQMYEARDAVVGVVMDKDDHDSVRGLLASRLKVAPSTLSACEMRAVDRMITDPTFRARYNRMLELLSTPSGDGADMQVEQ
jgi:hypothetical protein